MASTFAEISKSSPWKLLTLLFAACTMLPSSVLAQHPRSSVKTIGVLWSGTQEGTAAYWGTFLTADNLEQTVRFAKSIRVSTFTEAAQFAEAGILMSYGADYRDAFKRAAIQVDKVLKGAKPANLPWEQPTKFELVVSMNTAKVLHLTVPESIRLRATRVIR